MPDKTRKRQNEAISKKKKTLIKNIHKLGKLPGIDMSFTIRQNGARRFSLNFSQSQYRIPIQNTYISTSPYEKPQNSYYPYK
jgi:hypothetical protein